VWGHFSNNITMQMKESSPMCNLNPSISALEWLIVPKGSNCIFCYLSHCFHYSNINLIIRLKLGFPKYYHMVLLCAAGVPQIEKKTPSSPFGPERGRHRRKHQSLNSLGVGNLRVVGLWGRKSHSCEIVAVKQPVPTVVLDCGHQLSFDGSRLVCGP